MEELAEHSSECYTCTRSGGPFLPCYSSPITVWSPVSYKSLTTSSRHEANEKCSLRHVTHYHFLSILIFSRCEMVNTITKSWTQLCSYMYFFFYASPLGVPIPYFIFISRPQRKNVMLSSCCQGGSLISQGVTTNISASSQTTASRSTSRPRCRNSGWASSAPRPGACTTRC